MRLAHLDLHLEGEVLARTVLDAGGQLLLTAGTQLTERYIERLRGRGVEGVYIADDLSADIEPDVTLQRETRAEAVDLVEQAVARAEAQDPRGIPLEALRHLLDDIVGQLWRNQALAVDLTEVRSNVPLALSHSVECTVLALLMGEGLGLGRGDLEQLGTGVLLQDIGMSRFGALTRAARTLSPQEVEALQGHTEAGFRFLRFEVGLPALTAHVAYQHHERLDASGYPRKLSGDDIHLFGRIAAVADVYTALRGQGPAGGLPAHQAMRVLKEMDGGKLDAELVRRLSERVAVYSAGTPVLLSSGELAVVVAQGEAGPALPRVRVVAGADLRVCTPWELDLGKDAGGRTVRKVLPDYPESILRQLH